MNSRSILLAAAGAVALLTPMSWTLGLQQTQPATQVAGEELTATVAQVNGNVEVRKSASGPWEAAKVGMMIPIGGECRTGPRASITFTLPHNQSVTLDRLGVMKILDSHGTNAGFKTDLGMKYGRIRYEVEAGGLQHEATIRSPSAALAVNGSVVVLTDDALGTKAVVERGAGVYHPSQTGASYVMGTQPQASHGPNPLQSTPGSPPSQTYFDQAATPYFDATSITGNERDIISTNYSVGGLNTGITQELNPGPTSADRLITGTLLDDNFAPGDLKFTLTWHPVNPPQKGKPGGDGGGTPPPVSFADLDIVVNSPTGKTFTPLARAVHPHKPGAPGVSRDNTGQNDRGKESVSWKGFWPIGKYGYGVHYDAGSDPVVFTIKVTLNNKVINPAFHDTVSPVDRDVRFSIQVPPKTGIPPERSAARGARGGRGR